MPNSTKDDRRHPRPVAPSRGLKDDGQSRHVPDTSSPSTAQEPSSTLASRDHQCEGTNRTDRGKAGKGGRCRNMKSKFGHLADGSPAWRCRKHRKGWTPVEDTPGNATALGPMPSKLETKADMDRAYRWLMRASDHLNAAQVKNRLMILNARNKLRARMDEELVDAYRDLHDICTLLIGRYMKTRSEPVDPELEYFIEQYEQWRAKKDTKEAAWLADNELAQHVVSDRQKRATADAKVAKEQRKAAQAERARDMDSDPDDPDYDTGAPSPQHQRGAE